VSTWVFDVDGCLIDSLTGTSLRPGSVALLTHLRGTRCRVLLWSAGGADYARQRATEQGVAQLFDGFGAKDERDADGRYVVDRSFAATDDIVFVDDRPEDMPLSAEVLAVPPYLVDDRYDRGLHAVARWAGAAVDENWP
jgi:hypothetical protein